MFFGFVAGWNGRTDVRFGTDDDQTTSTRCVLIFVTLLPHGHVPGVSHHSEAKMALHYAHTASIVGTSSRWRRPNTPIIDEEQRQRNTRRRRFPSSALPTFVVSLAVSATMLLCSDMLFVSAFQPSSTVPKSSMMKVSGRRSARDVLSMLPISEVAEYAAADISSPISAGTDLLLAANNFELNDLLYKAQSLASDMASSSGILGGSGGGITAASLTILYGAGLLTSFSPCSLSLLPLTISYISASTTEQRNVNAADTKTGNPEGESASSLLPTLAFAAGLASVFVGLGLSAALLGAGVFGSATTTGDDGTVNVGKLLLACLSSGVSVAMGLQLLDIVRIPLPSFEMDVDSLMSKKSDETDMAASDDGDMDMAGSEIGFDEDGNLMPVVIASEGTTAEASAKSSDDSSSSVSGSLLRTFLLGGSTAFIADFCGTPVLASLLAYVASSRDPVVGATLLLTYALGYSTPLLLIGATGGNILANANAAADSAAGDDEGGWSMAKIGRLVTPLTATVLIWYGTTGFLEALIGDPSLVALAPILD